VIQAIYKGIEIEMEMHRQSHAQWRCDYTLIKHPQRAVRIEHLAHVFPTFDLAREYALQRAHAAIDRAS
jgi:endonuclease I